MKSKIIVGIVIILFLSMLHLIPFRTAEKKLTVRNTERSYFLHLPTGYDKTKSYPLVVMLHGYSDHPLLMELYSGMSKKADKEKFIVVYPKGTNDASDGNLSWNAEFCCGSAKRNSSEDIVFIEKLLDELAVNYSVDTRKVYVAGFSNGAMFAHVLATQIPSKITAVAAISGTIGTDTSYLQNPQVPVPILIMNGTADRTIPFNGTSVYASVVETVAFWKSINNTTEENVSNNTFSQKTTYADTNGQNEVLFYEIRNGRHLWFGRKRDSYALLLSRPIYTTEEIWEFFKKH